MKRFWLVLLSLGLVMAFSASVYAVDVKFSGEFYVGGMYLDKTTFKKDTATDGPSTALYFQRLRLRTDFVVSPGLSFVTRMDIMERAWGAARSAPGTAGDVASAATAAENENIAVDYAYIQYASPIGVFAAGYMINGAWGTVFGNTEGPLSKVAYVLPIGSSFTFLAQIAKAAEGSYTAKNTAGFADADYDLFYLMGIYTWKQGNAGLGLFWVQNASAKPTANYKATYLMIEPYVKANFGPVYVEAEVDYLVGKAKKMDAGAGDVDMKSLNAYISALGTFGPLYVGATFAYLQGEKADTTDVQEQGFTGGADWNPCLLMFSFDRYRWAGGIGGYGTSGNTGAMANAFFYQGKVGVKPNDKLDIMASVSYANADQKPTGYSDAYGWEIDVTGTYKITNNLSYMLGIGYFMTGDYYKAGTTGNISNDYIVINKLTLTF
jgi:hypothetical protein